MQILSMTSEYALLAMVYLALQEERIAIRKKSIPTVEEISKATGIPLNFLSKIILRLVKAGLVRSARGYHGGCMLALSSDKIDIHQIIEAVEGTVHLNHCTISPSYCSVSPFCPFYSMWLEAQNAIDAIFKKYTLHSIAVCIQGLEEEANFFASLRKRFEKEHQKFVGLERAS